MQVRGEVYSQGSWCGVQYGSVLLPSFSSRSLVLSQSMLWLVVSGVGMYSRSNVRHA